MGWDLVNFTIYNNSLSDVGEIKALIKFYVLRRELIIVGLRGDLFFVVLIGIGG